MRTAIVTLALTAMAFVVNAQTISPDADTIRWNVNSLNDTHANSISEYTCHFTSYGDDRLVWTQADYVIEFEIRSVKGSWNNLEQDGSKRYLVAMDGNKGEILFERKNGAVTIAFTFNQDGANALPYIFSVNDSQKI